MATNWSIMATRAQMEQDKLEEFNLKVMKSTADQSTTYVLIQSFIKQLTLVVKQCFFHACNKNDQLQLHPKAAIILQFLRCLGNVTSRNIRLYMNTQPSYQCEKLKGSPPPPPPAHTELRKGGKQTTRIK